MSHKTSFYPESRFGGFTDIDGTIAFFTRVNALLDPSFVVLDVGCARGVCQNDTKEIRRNLKVMKGKVSKVIGIDVDPGAAQNPLLDEFRLIENNIWPIEDDAIDLIVCDNVLEHVEDPDFFFSEIHRVLKNGGYLCLRTPNCWNYICVAARLIPNELHAKVTSFAQDSRNEEDVFPTFYRCNSVGKLKRVMKKFGIEGVVYGYEAEPSYFAFSKVAYLAGVLHQRLAPGFLKASLFVFGQVKK